MELIIVSPDYELNKTVAWIEINTPKGNYIIQKGHVPFIISLSPNEPVTYQLESGKKETIIVQSGTADINRTKIMLIIRIINSKK
jgi:F0F1-type ATP synthase epsilon subunit